MVVKVAEWSSRHEQGGPIMGLATRVKELRNEHGWSQGELADQVSADSGQIAAMRTATSRRLPRALSGWPKCSTSHAITYSSKMHHDAGSALQKTHWAMYLVLFQSYPMLIKPWFVASSKPW